MLQALSEAPGAEGRTIPLMSGLSPEAMGGGLAPGGRVWRCFHPQLPPPPGKASGGNGIPVELFKILKDDAVKVQHSICQKIWKMQQQCDPGAVVCQAPLSMEFSRQEY